MVKIYNATDNAETERILDLLKENNINAYVQKPGSGQYMQILMGYSVYGLFRGIGY